MTVQQAAQELGVSARRVRQLIEGGVLIAEALNPRLWLVERASVDRYQQTRRPAGRPTGDAGGSARNRQAQPDEER